jgi:hypothetical protein
VDDLDRPNMTEQELYEYLRFDEDLSATKRSVHDAVLRREILPTRIGRGNFFSKRDGLDWIASRKQTGTYRVKSAAAQQNRRPRIWRSGSDNPDQVVRSR